MRAVGTCTPCKQPGSGRPPGQPHPTAPPPPPPLPLALSSAPLLAAEAGRAGAFFLGGASLAAAAFLGAGLAAAGFLAGGFLAALAAMGRSSSLSDPDACGRRGHQRGTSVHMQGASCAQHVGPAGAAAAAAQLPGRPALPPHLLVAGLLGCPPLGCMGLVVLALRLLLRRGRGRGGACRLNRRRQPTAAATSRCSVRGADHPPARPQAAHPPSSPPPPSCRRCPPAGWASSPLLWALRAGQRGC